MTILWIYNMPLVPEAGGTERITSLVAKGLSERGHTCMSILVFDEHSPRMTYEGNPVLDLYSFLKENKVDIVINQIAYATWLLDAFLTRGGSRWREEGGKIISCLHFDPKPTSDYYLFKTKRNKSFRDYINIAKAAIFYSYYDKRQNKNCGRIYNWLYDSSDAFITLSSTHFPFFKEVTKRIEYDKLTSINNPLTFDDISDSSIIDEKKNVILVCSRMDEYQKRISIVLKAWKKIQKSGNLEGWTLKIVGDGPDLESYKSFARIHKLTNIEFTGRQTPEPYYREADIFLMTSTGIEGWGLTLTESLQRGVVPVVMNTCSVYSDIITNGYNGYLTEDNIKDLIKKIRALSSDQRKLHAMQNNALISSQRFSLSKTMEKWDKLLDNIDKQR